MKCFICSKESSPGGIKYFTLNAIGACNDCGIGICLKHSVKPKTPGAPLLCQQCASIKEV